MKQNFLARLTPEQLEMYNHPDTLKFDGGWIHWDLNNRILLAYGTNDNLITNEICWKTFEKCTDKWEDGMLGLEGNIIYNYCHAMKQKYNID